uniref:Kelch repeat F-box 7 protein n=1 Tax=Salvia miltiorrhiza TaxID=226208 RepID=A0A7H1K133_SALMI|nr:Kelch repeat F-box 7 protein [Salvia miltiorrhiza]
MDATIPIPKLPNDVIIEILTWLPVKSLLKFKCVCTSWRALISSQRFIKAHLDNSKLAPNSAHDMIAFNCPGNLKQCSVSSMLYESVSQVFDLGLPLYSLKGFKVEGSCNGLLLMTLSKRQTILWNPCTRTYKKLPHFGVEIAEDYYPDYDLGYDKSSDDYKVVGFFDNFTDLSDVIVVVYSLRNDEWKRIKNINGRNVKAGRAAFANGKLYYFTYPDYKYRSDWNILPLDLEKEEEYETLQMPSYVKLGDHSSLAVSEGSLFLLCTHLTCADVWMLDGSSVGIENWTKVVTMPCCPDGGWKYNRTMLLYVLKNGLVMFRGATFVVYNAKDGSFRYPRIRNTGESLSVGVYTYVESLVSPVGMG